MRRIYFELLAIGSFGASLFFFREALILLSRRDYVGASIVVAIGVSLLLIARDLSRFSLARSSQSHE